MQSNIYTNKITRKPSKNMFKGVDTYLKGREKGKTWKRETDKRSFNFDGFKGI